MKIDKRRSEIPNLNLNFRNYVSGKYLTGYYIFSENVDAEFLTNSALGDELADALYESSGSTYYPYISEKSSPYQGRTDKYSGVFRTYRKSDFRISYNNSTSPFVNNGSFTIACWVYLPDINTISPDSDLYIYQKIQPAGSASPKMEFSLEFVSTPGENKFVFSWFPTAAPATTKNLESKSCTEWKNPVGVQGQGGSWVHVAIVVKEPPGGASSYDAAYWLGNYVAIFCNGYKESLGGSTFGNTWTPKTATNGDLIIGKALYDNPGLSGDTPWNEFNIHSLAVWNTSLAGAEIRSMYEAAIQYEGSGIITNPPRDYLQKMDNRPGRYPTIKSSTDQKRLGKNTPFFDDTKTRIFWNFTPQSPEFNTYSYLSSWRAGTESRDWKAPPSGSLKFLAFLTASVAYNESFAEHSLNHPPLTASFPEQQLSRVTAYNASPGPIFNTTGSNSFITGSTGPYDSDCIAVTTSNITESAGSVSTHVWGSGDPSSTIAGMIPDGLSRYKDNLSFVKRGGTDTEYAYELVNPYIDGGEFGPSVTLALETNPTLSGIDPFPAGPPVSGYNKYLENTPQTISVWVNPAIQEGPVPDELISGSMTILSKGFWSMQHGEFGGLSGSGYSPASDGSPNLKGNVLAESAYEYRLLLTASSQPGTEGRKSYGVSFEVGSSYLGFTAYNDWSASDLRSAAGFSVGAKIDNAHNKHNALLRKTTASGSLGVQAHQWNHVVVSWNGKSWNTVDIYINGIKQTSTLTDNSLSSSFFGVTVPTTESLLIGATQMGNPVNQQRFKGSFFSGSINNIAMWDIKLTDDQAVALFAGASGSLSAYGNNPIKVSYPSLIEVSNGTELPLGSVNKTLAQISGSLATPNKMPDIVAVGNIAREIAYDFQAWSGSSDFSDSLNPFVENESYIDDSPFYSVGTISIPGFSAPLKDKIQVNIDITPRSDLRSQYGYAGQYIFRNWPDWSSRPASSEVSNVTRTGMYYWDPNNKLWNQVGSRNPQYRTGDQAGPMYGKLNQKRYGLAQTGSLYSCSHASQFMPYNYYQTTNAMLESIQDKSGVIYNSLSDDNKVTQKQTINNQVQKSLSHVGLPHCHNFAPFGSRYFATSSNLLKMSNYIDSPMLLEKMELDFGQIIANQNFDFGDDYLCSSPFSMYTFFLYRQTQQNAHAFVQMVDGEWSEKDRVALDRLNSGSQRELIGWSTAVFYNQFASSSLSHEAMTGSGLFTAGAEAVPTGIWNVPISLTSSLHADFYHSWDVNPVAFSSTQRAQYTGSMKLQFTPKICGPRVQMPSMFTALYPWTPNEYIPLNYTMQRPTAMGPGAPNKPGGWQTIGGGYGPGGDYGLILTNSVGGSVKLGGTSTPNQMEHWWQRGPYTCGTNQPAYGPWIGSNTNQTSTPHRVWDTGTVFGAGPPRTNVYSWPGGSSVLPFSASAVLQAPRSGSLSPIFLAQNPIVPGIEFQKGTGRGQRPNNDSGFIGKSPNFSSNLSMNFKDTSNNWYGLSPQGIHSSVVGAVIDSGSTPSDVLFNTKTQYQNTMNPASNHYPKFAPSTPPLSASIVYNDFSSDVSVISTTFLLHPDDTLILGVEKINVPPHLAWYAIGATYTGSHPSVAGSGSFQVDNTGGNDDRQNAKGGRYYGIAPDHYREKYNAGVHSASFLRITSKNQSWLRLYGSLVKNNREYFPSSPQQLTSDAVHEALHYDNPVLDQWEIAGEIEYTGSLRTQYITGRMTRPRIGTLRRPRTIVSPNLISGSDSTFAPNLADNTPIGLSNRRIIADNSSGYGDMFSFNRNITLVENNKVYYDSMPPQVGRLWNRDGFQAAIWYSSFYQGGSRGDGYGGAGGGTLNPAGDYDDDYGHGAGTGGEYVWTRKYYYSWLMGHGTGSRSKNEADGAGSKVRYFLNGWDSYYNAQPFGMVPGNFSPTSRHSGKYYFALATGSSGDKIEGLTGADVPVHGKVGNHVWPSAFPFEPRYKNIRRVLNQDFSYANNLEAIQSAVERPIGSGSTIGMILANMGDLNSPTFGGVGYVIDCNRESALPPNARRSDRARSSVSLVCTVNRNSLPITDDYISYLHKRRSKNGKTCAFAIFGRGYSNRYLDVVKSMGPMLTMPNDGADAGTDSGGFWGVGDDARTDARNRISGSFGVVAKPSGFKYGLINAVEQNPNIVYRGNKFGQFRDMLEQRPYTRYFNKIRNRISRNNWVVKSKFQEPTWTDPSGKIEKKEPSETQSCNLSTFSTSSLPFFDEVDLYPNGRNRGGAAIDADVSVILTPGFRTAGGGFPSPGGPFSL